MTRMTALIIFIMYRFDEYDHNIKTSIYKYSLDSIFQQFEYKYNELRKIIETTQTYNKGDTNELVIKCVKLYDDKGNKVEESLHYPKPDKGDGDAYEKWTVKHIYNSEGNKLEENGYHIYKLFDPSESKPSLDFSYIFDGKGQLLGTTTYSYSNRRKTASYPYDLKYNRILSVYYDSEDSSTITIIPKFDDKGNPIKAAHIIRIPH